MVDLEAQQNKYGLEKTIQVILYADEHTESSLIKYKAKRGDGDGAGKYSGI